MTVLNVTSTSAFKFDLPPTCMITMMKKALIEKMDEKYFLSSHPYPRI